MQGIGAHVMTARQQQLILSRMKRTVTLSDGILI
jgi:hypothetical protein